MNGTFRIVLLLKPATELQWKILYIQLFFNRETHSPTKGELIFFLALLALFMSCTLGISKWEGFFYRLKIASLCVNAFDRGSSKFYTRGRNQTKQMCHWRRNSICKRYQTNICKAGMQHQKIYSKLTIGCQPFRQQKQVILLLSLLFSKSCDKAFPYS